MEAVSIGFKTDLFNVTLVCIYRPPYSKKNRTTNKQFLEELPTVLSHFQHKETVFCGDLNLHFDSKDDSSAKTARNLISDFNLQQLITEPTHEDGHTLDPIIASDSCPIDAIFLRQFKFSDHFAVFFSLLGAKKDLNSKRKVTSRCLKRIDELNFKNDTKCALDDLQKKHNHCHSVGSHRTEITENVTDKQPPEMPETPAAALPASQISEFTHDLNAALSEVLESHAPLRTRYVTDRPSAPWRTDEVLEAKRDLRRAEEKCRNNPLTVNHEIYKQKRMALKKLNDQAKEEYFCSRLDACTTSKEMYSVTDEMFPSKTDKTYPNSPPLAELPEAFSNFFMEKVSNIRAVLDQSMGHATFSSFSGDIFLTKFSPVSNDFVRELLTTHPLKMSDMDPLPPSLFRLCLEDLVPIVTSIINDSLSTGVVPDVYKIAKVHPLLKKTDLDPDNMKNYRPVSNLPLLSKLLERVVLIQLQDHIKRNGLLDDFQSAYKKNHSCETALLYIMNNLVSNADSKQVSLLALLDLSAAFDTIDHRILLSRLNQTFGISGMVLRWFESYLSDRSQMVSVDGKVSQPAALRFGVPQGSVLGPVLFTLYVQPLSDIIKDENVDHHKYADDTQILDSGPPSDISNVEKKLEVCIDKVSDWMTCNKLKLNGDKTELLVSGTKHFLSKLNSTPALSVGSAKVSSSTYVKDLGVLIDQTLTMHNHISNVCSAANYAIKQLSSVRKFLNFPAAVQLVSSLVLSRLDYCNSLLYGLPDCELNRLQNVQNNAARMIFRRSRRHSVTPLLVQLHWLPIEYRVKYKIAVFAFQKFHDGLPSYLSSLLKVERKAVNTRSSLEKRLEPLTNPRTKTHGDRMFTVSASVIWNDLPRALRESDTLTQFKSRLKTHYFRVAFPDA
jgi:hypothetical protein